MIPAGTSAEEILNLLGITDPDDLDVGAIAFACGAIVLQEPLTGCEANIIGSGDKAIITVNSTSIPTRQRFSAGHELGHWMKDRGQTAFGCSTTQLYSEWAGNNPETRANRFASDLLLPVKMFVPLAKNRPVTLETVGYLATVFKMSRTAIAIRLVNHGSFPSMLVRYEAGKRKWVISGDEIPKSLFPPDRPQPCSVAASLIANNNADNESQDVRADRWFQCNRAEKYYIRESCFRTGADSLMVLLWWEDEQQLIDIEEEEERRASRRSDYRDDF